MSTTDELFLRYQGQPVPRSFSPLFVVLSFIVSFIGAASTLELINRRTSRNGLLNHVFLVSAAVTMGGISIWSMHFVGNGAIILAEDQPELQIVYSDGFTAISFFLPIIVLLAAFVATGTNSRVSFGRTAGGGTLAGGAICGMHYIGNASIANYNCQYKWGNVVGSAIIAVVASMVALSIFFLLRASWTDSWWKRGLSAVLLASAVSGMHWCAAIGTSYRLVKLNGGDPLSRSSIVVVVTILSLGAALTAAGVVLHDKLVARSSATKARHVVLAVAVFDQAGRILVNPNGLLPSEKVTDTYIEQTPSDTFSIENPLFQWMFQASRNWPDMSNMIGGMADHLAVLAGSGRGRSVRLVSDDGQLTEHYDVIFRELFCLAAANLAARLKEDLTSIGILWDDILPTGGYRKRHSRRRSGGQSDRSDDSPILSHGQGGRGSLMFLVRRLEHAAEVDKFEAAGFRFADVHQVSGIIRAGMQIETADLGGTLLGMCTYAEQKSMEAGVYLGFFGIRARVDSRGFDVLVEKWARNLLPSLALPLKRLEPWHVDFLSHYDGLCMPSLRQRLADESRGSLLRESSFASLLASAISTFRTRIADRVFDEAIISCRPVQVPCRSGPGSHGGECSMIVMHVVIPIHDSPHSPGCEFIPLSFFKVHQMVYKNSPHQNTFTRHLYRRLMPVSEVPAPKSRLARRSMVRMLGSELSRLSRLFLGSSPGQEDPLPLPLPLPLFKGRRASRGSSNDTIPAVSTFKPCRAAEIVGEDKKRYSGPQGIPPYAPPGTITSNVGGILVSQEIKVDITRAAEANGDPFEDDRQWQGQGLSVHPAQNVLIAPSTRPSELDHRGGMRDDTDRYHFDAGPALDTTYIPGSTIAANGSVNEIPTFVDELFLQCIKRR
ncbi:hypothetical protein GGS20DRAFT_584851 [Poronia punctata]|nr:hypothetical protein GGS20DRAFT_584851 [Poronia punctata]